MNSAIAKTRSTRALEATNFFLADVQTGLGPFIAAYLASSGWNEASVGQALTVAGIVSVVVQTPAGALVDRIPAKRAILILGAAVLAFGALLLTSSTHRTVVYAAQTLIGIANPFLGPTLAALTMGIVGPALFDRQFGRNQSFNSAGNVACALAIALLSHHFGTRSIFVFAALLAVPTILAVLLIRRTDIDDAMARGSASQGNNNTAGGWSHLLRNRMLLLFLLCAFLFHLANAAMLPQLGELLAKGNPRSAASFMAACIVITQLVISCSAAFIGRYSNLHGRKAILIVGFAVLPLRGFLYTLWHAPAFLIGVQVLDGIANAIWVVVSILVVADLSRGSGRFNFAQGALATAVGTGAALSNTIGGHLITRFSYRISFLTLAAIALLATVVLWFGIPETLGNDGEPNTAGTGA